MEEEVMATFYMRSCINKNNFLLSCSRKRKRKASLLLCTVKNYQQGECSLCLHLLETLSFVITVEHSEAKVQGPGTVWEGVSQAGHLQH